jgi:hypothetical protein
MGETVSEAIKLAITQDAIAILNCGTIRKLAGGVLQEMVYEELHYPMTL